MTEKVACGIRNTIGSFIVVDERTLGGVWRSILRIRVTMNIKKAIVRRLHIRKEGVTGFGQSLNMSVFQSSASFVEFWDILIVFVHPILTPDLG
ncbi:unnamed protein product [Cuscuta epithymum]|uniref:Uncharacterized protein n=1 Tax=Cuscuta epithymum TaxID=186058 RepID=A0AAV0E7I7_9ASTE|nr:unnamed protein product [Cuscuta epithymum]